MPDDYSITSDGGRRYWYKDSWGSLIFDWSDLSPAPSDASNAQRVLMEEAPMRGRSKGWYRFFSLRSRERIARERMQQFFESLGKRVVVFPEQLVGGFHSGFDCHFGIGKVRVHAREIRKENGVPIVNVYSRRDDADLLFWPAGEIFRRAYRRLAIQKVQAFIKALGGRVVFEQFQS